MVLVSQVNVGQTIVQNAFIDRYMAAANGEYVKVYLLLLRLAGIGRLSVSELADRLDITEKDVMRALAYWENAGLVTLSRSGDDLSEMTINGFDAPAAAARTAAPKSRPVSEAVPAPAAPAAVPQTAAEEELPDETPQKPRRSQQELAEDEDYAQIVYVAEKYLGRTLKPKDLEILAWMYDELAFPADVIEYLIEYCVESGKTKTEYLEKVAMGWHADGIRSVEQAKQQVRAYKLSSGNYYAVLKAFGIYNRAVVPREAEFVDRWTRHMGFAIEVVQAACAEAMRKNVKQPFDYTNKILEKWQEAGLKSPADVRRYLEEGRESFRQAEEKSAEEVQQRRQEKRRTEHRQAQERDVLAARRAKICQDMPEFEKLEAEIIDLSAKRDLETLNGADARAEELKQKILSLREKKTGLLAAAGFPADYLERV